MRAAARRTAPIRILGSLTLPRGALRVVPGLLGATTFFAMPDLLPPEYTGLPIVLAGLSFAGLATAVRRLVAG